MSEQETVGAEFEQLWGEYIQDERYTDALAVAQDPTARSFYVPHAELSDLNAGAARDLVDAPDEYLPILRDALTGIDWAGKDYQYVPDAPFADVTIRITGLPDTRLFDVGQWNPNDVADELIAVRGQVTRRSKRQLRDDVVVFECGGGCDRLEVIQSGEFLQSPAGECDECGKQYTPLDAESTVSNYQRVRVQGLPEQMESTSTEQIDVQFTDDLVGAANPGDRVVITGVLRTSRQREGNRKKRLHDLYVEGLAVEKLETDHDDMDVEPYRDEVRELAERDDIFEQWVDSIAPQHTGDRIIKKALALQLVGGVQKPLPDGSEKRGTSHVLLIGDPGTGKSSLIRYVSNLVPRAEYATGKQSSSAGLTATAVKDDWGGDGWTLEAGTLVRAHNGIAAIDELDKMDPDDRSGMIEAMSEQTITINKAASGTLPASTTVVAAANPEYGTFDPMEDVGEQLDLDPVLLSRFDLWFVMEDETDEERDSQIADHINTTTRAGQKLARGEDLDDSEREATEPAIEQDTLRAYIAIAREHVPVLTDDAMEYIGENYVELRQSNDSDGPVPVTARSIEAIHRLAEASARIRLSDRIEAEDVERAIAIRDHCLDTLGVDPESGELDAMRLEMGQTKSQRDRVRTVRAVVRMVADDHPDEPGAPRDTVVETCVDALNMDESKVEHELDRRLANGAFHEPRRGYIQVT